MTRPVVFILALFALAGQVCAQTQTDAISREFTVYVDMATYPPITDAVSREFTVYIGNQPLREQTDAVTREFTVFLDTAGGGNVITDAVSREFTVYIGNQPLREQTDDVTREFTVYFGNQPLREQTDAVSRECTAFVGDIQIAADLNCDGIVDSDDIAEFAACMGGPGTPVTPLCSPGVDLDGDGDADLVDFAIFQILFP